MYSNQKVKTSYDKFISYLKEHIDMLSSELEEYDKKHSYYEMINELKNNPSLETIQKSRKFLVSLNPEINKYFNVIDFFISRGAKEAPQIDIAIKSIMSINEIKSFSESANTTLNKSLIEEEMEQYMGLLNGTNLDIDLLVVVLNKSHLTDREQLDVLSKICFDRIQSKKIDEKLEEEKTNIEEENMDKKVNNDTEELVSIDDLIDRITLMLPTIEEIKSKYSYLVKDKTEGQINYASLMSKLCKSNDISFEDAQLYSNEIMMTLYLSILSDKEEIDKLIDKSTDDMLVKSDEELLELYINEIEHNIIQFKNICDFDASKTQTKEVKEELKKLLFLTDSRDRCVLGFNGFRSNEVETLFEKCKKGLWRKEYKLGPRSEFSVMMNNVSKTACVYVPISDTYNLVIELSHISDAHDRGIDRAVKNYEVITNYVEACDLQLDHEYEAQSSIRDEIKAKYNVTVDEDGRLL